MNKIALIIMTALSMIAATPAATAESKCTVTFMAILGGQPALKPTVLTIRQDGKVVLESKTSAATIKTLECGKLYVSTVTTQISKEKKVTRTRTIMLLSSTRLIMAMDP